MKKRLLACLMCILMVAGSLPVMPLTDYIGMEAVAVNVESLSEAMALVPPEEWDKYIDTKDLEREYNIALRVLKNPEGFDQDYIDDCTEYLLAAIEALEYHTTGIILNNSTYTAKVGDVFTLRAILAPDGKGADPVVWSSNNPQAASVEGGVVTVYKHSEQPVRITATSNGYSATCEVTTLNPFGGVTISHSTLEIFEGDRFTLTATAYGADSSSLPTDKVTYTWKSSNMNVVTVSDNGLITAVGDGECTVTVTATSGTSIYTATCTVKVHETIPVSSLSSAELSTSKTVNITVGEEYNFDVLVLPSNATNKNLRWFCTDDTVLSISGIKTSSTGVATAKLTGLKEGTTEVTYVTTDGTDISGSFTVVVKPLISSLALVDDIKVLTMTTSGERFSTIIMPENAGNQTLSWKTSDKNVCEVDYNGVLYPRGLGTCTITATTQDGTNITVSGHVRVTEMASFLTVSKASLSLAVPASYKLTATVVNVDGTSYSDVKWSSGDTKIATVDKNGVVTAKYPGVVVIKAEAMDGTEKYDTCILTVTQPLEGLTLPETKGVYLGNSLTLSPTFIPEYASNKKVTWSSSDNSVATVDQSGIVNAKGVGKTTITCTSEDGGFVASCVVTVLIQTTGVSLNYTSAKIWKDQTVTLVPTITPENATNKNVTWTSSDPSVAQVDENGVVTGVAGGTCTITCTTANSGRTAKCTITVLESATGVSFASDKISLYLGQTYYNKASVIPSTATNQNVSWATNNDLVVRVAQDGELTAVGEGTAIVTVKTEDGGFIATCEVTVYSKVPVTGLKLDKTTLSLDVGEYYTFLATVYPSNASDKGITWRTDNSSVVAVSQTGLIKAKSAGTAIITATTDDGNFTQQCKVTVSQPVTGIRLNVASVSIAKGKQKSLIANVLPTNATNKEIMWESSDEDVAVVSHTGLVTAVGSGNCTITATTVDGLFTATCDFTVYTPVTSITIGATEMKIPRGEVRLLSATVYPSDASNKTISWHSSNTNVATVNEVGQVTAKTRGTAVIYATSNDGGFMAQCVVQVVQLATSVSLNFASVSLDVGAYKQFTATLTPATVSDTTVKWSTSNKNVVAVSSKGLIKGVGPGTATITCRSGDGAVSTTCKITVTQPVTGLKLSPTSMNVKENGLKAITATVEPANATDSKVHWLSSNPTIASVDADGIVYGHKPGTVTVTAMSNNNSEITATCKVTVIRAVTGISLNKSAVTMNVGTTATVKVNYSPADASIKTAKWSSSNYDVADVDSNGNITAKAPGYAIITAKSTDGGYTATCSVLCIRPVTGVSLSDKTLSLEVDEKYTLKANVKPSDASDKAVTWSSSDKSVATVSSSGVITGKAQGTATITCKTVDGSYKASCTVTVLKKVKGISLNYSSKVLYLDKTLQLKATVTPTDATDKSVYWYTFDKNIATVDQKGLVTPVGIGSTTIGVKTTDGSFKAYCQIEVRKAVEKISLNKSSLTIYVDDYYTLKATLLPDDATVKAVTWSVSDSTVLAISSKGLIKGKSSGTATVTATTENGLKATCKVTVLQSVEGVELNNSNLTLYTGETEALIASVLPAGAHNQGVKWNSSDTKVATVSSKGVITAVKAGKATITVTTSEGGYSATCEVIVKQHVTSIGFNVSALEIRKGEEADLTVKVLPADATNKAYSIISSDPQILFVNDNGHLVALKGGNATVTVIAEDNNMKGICHVTVVEPVSGVTLEKEEDTVYVGDKLVIGTEISPSDATYKTVTWSSSDPKVASVNSEGVITVLKSGEAIITVTTVDGGFTDHCVLTCLQAPEEIVMEKAITVLRGEGGTLNVTVLPDDSYDKTVTFESDNEQVVRVDDNGSFITLAPGTAKITVTAVMGGASAECIITVIEPVTSVNITEKEVTVYKGSEYDFDATIYPANASNQLVLWKVSNPAVAKIDSNGVLTALADGETYVTVTTVDGRYIDFCKVNIVLAVESITVENDEISLIEEETAEIIATVLPEKAYNKAVTFVSGDEAIATVDENGKVTAVSKGETFIDVISVDNREVTATVKVTVIRVVEEIELSFDKEYLWNGETGTVSVVLIPADPTDESVVFSSSDETIATVDANGVVTALKAGEATITVATTDGRASAEITVEIRQRVTGVELDTAEKTVSVDDVFDLTASILPADAYNKNVVWTSSDEDVLTVVDGKVTALKTGEATITAKSAENGDIKAECTVTVIRMAETIEAEFDKEYLWVGENGSVVYEVLPEDTTDKSVVFSSNDETIATVDANGVVTALKAGEATITVATTDGRASAEITVEIRQQVEGIELTEAEKTVSVDDVFDLTASILPADAYNKNVVWTSSDEEVLTVVDGKVTALKTGTATITAASAENGDIKASCAVTVIRMAESILAEFDKEYLWVGENGNVVYEVLPEDTTDKSVVFTSSDETIATVDANGVVTALKAGEATITVATTDGRASAEITVEIRQQVEGIELSETEKTVSVDDVFDLTASILPADAYNKEVIWTSSDEEVLTVVDGKVTALRTGEATITAKSAENGEIKAECVVTVIRMAESIVAEFDKEYLWVGENGNVLYEVLPEDTTDKSVVFTSNDETIATVDANGVVTALKAGEATITVATTDGRASAEITVEIRQQVEGIELTETEKTVSVDDVFDLTASILPADAYNKEVIWTSSDEEVLTVVDGKVTALRTGEATITAKSAENGEIKAECVVTVIRMAESIVAEFDKEYLWVGENGNVVYEVLPEDTTDKSVVFSSSDETIVTVDANGVVTALKAGEATITVATTDGRASAEVTVEIRQQVEGIELTEAEKTVSVDDVFDLTASILPADAYNKNVVWTSSDEEVLTVVDGKVTALRTGTATITAASAENGEILDECTVTVIKYITSISFKESEIKLEKGGIYFIEASYLPTDATETELTWISSDESVLQVLANGKVKALKAGEAKLTVKTVRDEIFAECIVSVEVKSEAVELDTVSAELYCGDTLTLTATVLPEDATNKSIIWATTDDGVLTVDENGVVTAVGKGTAKIVATTEDTGVSAECEITVHKHVDSVVMDKHSYTAYVGREFTLSAEVTPADAHITDIIWKTSDSTVATVENGRVVPLRKGTVIISAYSVDGGFVDYCFVNVGIGMEAISFDKTEMSIHKGESFSIEVTVSPDNATAKELIWTTTDSEIATVVNGTVTAGNKSGTVTIKAVSADNSEAFAECTVTVIEQVTYIILNEDEIELLAEESFTLVPVIIPDNATYPETQWKSSDETVAIVDENGVVTAVAPGSAVITCTNKDSLVSAICRVYVPTPVQYFTLELGSLSLSKGASAELSITAYPAGHDESFTFASSDNTVLTVDSQSGVVSGVGAGTATVTAVSSLTGKTAEIEILVIQPVEGISFELSEYNGAYTGLTHQLRYNIYPADAYDKSVRFESSDEEIATVTADGTITYHKKGEVTIRVISLEKGLYSECKVKVAQSPETIYITSSTKTLSVGEEHQLGFVITPIDSDNQTVFWSSTASDVVSVDQNGKITALMPGTATITVTTWNGKTGTCKVTVE